MLSGGISFGQMVGDEIHEAEEDRAETFETHEINEAEKDGAEMRDFQKVWGPQGPQGWNHCLIQCVMSCLKFACGCIFSLQLSCKHFAAVATARPRPRQQDLFCEVEAVADPQLGSQGGGELTFELIFLLTA